MMECDDCGKNNLAAIFECIECNRNFCYKCDTLRHENPIYANHNRSYKFNDQDGDKLNVKLQSEMSVVACENCGKNNLATIMQCSKCNTQLCPTCDALRHENPNFMNHYRIPKVNEIVSPQQTFMECDNCGTNDLADIFECADCQTNLCTKCDTLRHKNAKFANHIRNHKVNVVNNYFDGDNDGNMVNFDGDSMKHQSLPNQVAIMECDNCGATNLPTVLECTECKNSYCPKCDTSRHENPKYVNHYRIRKVNNVDDGKLKDQINEFKALVFGEPKQLIDNVEFVKCPDRTFSFSTLNDAYQKCTSSTGCSLLKLLVAEIRDACRYKDEFDKVLYQATKLGPIARANVNDFIICLQDGCKYRWQQQNIVECLATFDYPVIIGHNYCSMKTSSNERNSFTTYGLHLGELYHLMYCGQVESENQNNNMINVLSLGTPGVQNKSRFLNEIWKTKFELWSQNKGLHHNGLLELQIGTDKDKRNQHIIDLHGDLNSEPCLQSLCKAADVVILHCQSLDFDLINQKANDHFRLILNFIQGSKSCQKAILVFHNLSSNSWASFKQKVQSIIQSNWNIETDLLLLNSQWEEKQNLHELQEFIGSSLKSVKPKNGPLRKLYNSLCEVQQQDKKTIQNKIPMEFEALRKKTADLLQSQDKERLNWFPLHKNSTILASLEEEQYESVANHEMIKIEQLKVKEKRNKVISAPVELFRDDIVNKEDLDEAALSFAIFQQELNRRFQPFVEDCRKQLKDLKEDMSKKPTQELKKKIKEKTDELIGYDIACIHFIRELIERGKDKIDEKASNGAISASQNELIMGRSIEVINGDSLTIPTEFLQDVLEPIFQTLSRMNVCESNEVKNDFNSKQVDAVVSPKQSVVAKIIKKLGMSSTNKFLSNGQSLADFISITVIGVESSGKSTLWNELWNTNFPVAHGKCSRGLWSAFVQVHSGPSFLVNDTEGILSPLCVKPRFDQKLVLLAFALSHIVVVNIRGEGDRVLIDLLKLIIYAAHMLSVLHRPQIVFVHRDVMGVKAHEQGAYKNILLSQLHDACRTIEKEEGIQLKLDDIIDVEHIHSFDLPSAINEVRKDVAGCTIVSEEKTAEFVIRCRQLRCRLIEMSREIVKDKSHHFSKGLGGEEGWVNYAQRIWELARQNASLFTFASVHDMLQRRHIEKKLIGVLQNMLNNVNQQTMNYISNMKAKSQVEYKKDLLGFPSFLSKLQNECETEMEKSINQIVGDYSGPSTPADVVVEYKAKIKRDIENNIEEKRQILQQIEQNRRLKEELNSKIEVLTKKIDNLKGKNYTRAQIEEMFDNFVVDVMKEMETVHGQTDASEIQMQAVNTYVYLNSSLSKQFAPEFVRRYIGLQEIGQKADEMNRAFWDNVSTRLNKLNFIERPENEINIPAWVQYSSMQYIQRTCYNFSKATRIMFYLLEDEVFTLLWVNNMKKVESDESLGQRDFVREICNQLCEAVDTKFVDKVINEKTEIKTSFFGKNKSVIVPVQTGFKSTITNLFHAFACSMLYYFIHYHYMHVRDIKIQKFRDFCNTRKNEIVLRADSARNADDAVNKMVKLILDSLQSYKETDAIEAIRQRMSSWSIESSILVEEAMECTFRAGDFDGAYEFVISPVKFLKKLFCNHFCKQFDMVKESVAREFLDTANESSSINKSLDMIVLATNRWYNNNKKTLFPMDAVRELFAEFERNEQSFEKEIVDSAVMFIENTQKQTKINYDDFSREMHQRLTDKTEICSQCKFRFVVSGSIKNDIFEELWPKNRGCEETCPYCGQKCSGNLLAHTSHDCNHHLLLAFNGWRDKKTRNASLRLCTEQKSFTNHTYQVPEKFKTGDDKTDYVPFAEHIHRFHPDWHIVPSEQNEDIGETEKVAWLVIGDKLAEHFHYNNKTPEEWETLYRERANRLAKRVVGKQETTNDWNKKCEKELKNDSSLQPQNNRLITIHTGNDTINANSAVYIKST